jgi:hypothetical protein
MTLFRQIRVAQMAKVRKRKPGGGRKPSGSIKGKVEAFSTRITPETRQALEAEAESSGQSISQVAERLLMSALNSKRERERDKPMRALCFVIAELAHQAVGLHSMQADGSERAMLDWRTNRFCFRAFKIAVGKLLDALEPPGEITPPPIEINLDQPEAEVPPGWKAWIASFESPQARGEYAADRIVNYSLHTLGQLSPEERDEKRRFLRGAGVPSWWREFYGMPDAARDLSIPGLSTGTISDRLDAAHRDGRPHVAFFARSGQDDKGDK